MGNRLDVDTSAIKSVSKKIDEVISSVKSKHSMLGGYADELAVVWQGDDATKFLGNYRAVVGSDGWIKNLEENLAAYSNYLQICAKEYEQAAERCINKASDIR